MESNKLAIIDNKLPLKAYPEQKIDEVLNTIFKFWLANLLSIKADNEQKLDLALTAVKKHFWSLGLNEVKKAFEMYAYGQLRTKPVSNHIDIILVGTIFNEYKEQKVVPKKEPNPIKDVEEVTNIQLYKFFKAYFITGLVNDCYVESAYKWLDENGFLELTKEEKLKYMEDAEVMIIINKKENGNLKDKLTEFKKEDITQDEKVFQAKKIALRTYLKNATIVNGKEIEKKLKP